MERFLPAAQLTALADDLAGSCHVLAPVAHAGSVVFRWYRPGMRLEFSRMASTSPKAATFPQTEPLLVAQRHEEHKQPVIEATLPPQARTVVLGCRPCGARGKEIFGPVFLGVAHDPYFARRREDALFVSLVCTRPETTCFCSSVGGGPADTTGSDVLLIPVQGGFVARSVTEAGAAFLQHALFEDVGARGAEADAVVAQAQAAMPPSHDFSSAPAKLLARFDDKEFWEQQSAKCISCGACTYMCPTCYCFNITDDDLGLISRRIRTWDNCMSYTFTLEASGHNPRPTKAHRLKNRVGHKFSYYPSIHNGVIACCGCGRCIKHCPAGVDIRAIVHAAQEYAQ